VSVLSIKKVSKRVIVRKGLEAFIDRQYRQPTGIIGQLVGRRMARQHQPENAWTVSLLDIQPTDRVLEVGFGPGIAVELLAAQASQGFIAGVDFSPAMISLARRRNARAINAGQVELGYGEVTALPFADASFDKALSIHTLYFWTDPVKALTELRRVLKPEGDLVLTFLARDRWPEGETAATISGVYAGWQVVQLMREAGFALAHVEDGPEQKPFREIAVVARK
jgi:ubiquinone/menaquinone biosynthesis C-methylase UbiE